MAMYWKMDAWMDESKLDKKQFNMAKSEHLCVVWRVPGAQGTIPGTRV